MAPQDIEALQWLTDQWYGVGSSMSSENHDEPEEFLEISFIFENWCIATQKTLLQQMKTATEAEKRTTVEDLYLVNQFKLRRLRDLGLNWFISTAIQNDNEFFNTLKQTFMQILSEIKVLDPEKIQEKLNNGAIHHETIPLQGDIRMMAQQEFERGPTIHQVSIRYYENRLRQSLANHDYDEVQVIEQLLEEWKTGQYKGYMVLKPHDPLKGSLYKLPYYFVGRGFLHEHVRFLDIYHSNVDFLLQSIIIFFDLELGMEIQALLDWRIGPSGSNSLYFKKFFENLVSISSIIWFMNQPREEKLRILNQTYPIAPGLTTITQKLVDHSASIPDYSALMQYWHLVLTPLHQRGYFFELVQMVTSILTTVEHLETLPVYYLYETLATAYRELGDHKNALTAYLNAKKYIKDQDISPTRKTYNELLCLIRIGEELCQLGQNDEGMTHLNEVTSQLQNVINQDKGQILMNLAGAARRLNDTKLEKHYLNNLLDHVDTLSTEYAEQTMNYIEQRVSTISSPTFEHEELIERFDKYQTYGNAAFSAFNFPKALDQFSNAFSLIEHIEDPQLKSKDLFARGRTFYCMRQKEAALYCFEQVLAIEPKHFDGLVYLTALTIDQNHPTRDEGLHRFISRYVDTPSFFKLLQGIFFELLQIRGLINLQSDLQTLEKLIKIEPDLFYLNIGNVLADYGFLQQASTYLLHALNKVQRSSRKAEIQTSLGMVYANQDRHEEAIKWYLNALEEAPGNTIRYKHISLSYASIGDFHLALEYIDKTVELTKDDPSNPVYTEVRRIQKYYEHYRQIRFNYTRIPAAHKNIKIFLRTGDWDFLEGLKKPELRKLDASKIIISYSKALETILHEQIAQPFLKYFNFRFAKSTPDRIQYALDRSSPVKWLIARQDSISHGSWIRILKPRNHQKSDVLNQLLKQFIETELDPNFIDAIYAACAVIKKARNLGSHTELISFEEVTDLRSQIVKTINSVINLLY